MHDEELTPYEQQQFEDLPREMPIPKGLEERVANDLKRTGAIRSLRSPWLWQAAAAVLIAVGGFAAGRLPASPPVEPAGDKFLLLLYGGPAVSAAEEQARVAEYAAWAGAPQLEGRVLAAERLGDGARVFGPTPGTPASDSQPAGFFLIRAESAEQADAIAQTCPHVNYGGTVVVRPIVSTDD